MKFRNSNVELDYSISGAGIKTLVLLHGLGSDKSDWNEVLDALSKVYTVVTVDLRGHGQTKVFNQSFTIEDMAADVWDLLMDLKFSNLIMVGFSMGGAVAFQMAITQPDALQKLIIINSGPDFKGLGDFGYDLLTTRTSFVKSHGIEKLAEDIAHAMLPDDAFFVQREAFRERCASNDPDVYLDILSNLLNWSIVEELDKLYHPTLFLCSAFDYTPVESKMTYAKRMKNADVVVIPNSRHGMVYDSPFDMYKQILQWEQKS